MRRTLPEDRTGPTIVARFGSHDLPGETVGQGGMDLCLSPTVVWDFFYLRPSPE